MSRVSGSSASGAGGLTPTVKTASYSAVDGDYVLLDASGGAATITAPTAAKEARFAVKKTDSSTNTVTVAITADGYLNPVLNLQRQSMEFLHDGDAWRVVGT